MAGFGESTILLMGGTIEGEFGATGIIYDFETNRMVNYVRSWLGGLNFTRN